MKRYGCARGSIDTAIGDLARGGYVYSRQGKGTFVADKQDGKCAEKIYLVGHFTHGGNVERSWTSSPLASEIQRHAECYVFHSEEMKINLGKIINPSSAVIWIRPSYSDFMVMNYLENAGVPQLLVGRNFGSYDHVRTDAAAGIKQGLEWLVEEAGREMAYISETNNPDLPYIAERHIAFYESCVDLGVQLRREWLHIKPFNDMGAELNQIVDSLLSGSKKPKAIFLSFIAAALPLVTLVESKGYKLGTDFKMLLFDQELWLKDRSGIGMIRQNWKAMDRLALEWALGKIKGDKQEYKMKVKPEFITG
jgi:DNA-binding LacI/PurR family transcriptional regulator